MTSRFSGNFSRNGQTLLGSLGLLDSISWRDLIGSNVSMISVKIPWRKDFHSQEMIEVESRVSYCEKAIEPIRKHCIGWSIVKVL